MSRYPHAKFILSADAPAHFPPDDGHEVAFAGRSNAGKSSAINAIVARRRFARVSKSPGRTQLINFFDLADGQRLVDLPGYGFAQVPEATRRHWGQLIESYFRQRRSLSGLVLVMDIRRGLTDFDRRLLEFAGAVEVPVHVLLSKSDKLKRGQAASAQREAGEALGKSVRGVQLFSATRNLGVEQARECLADFLHSAGRSPAQAGEKKPG